MQTSREEEQLRLAALENAHSVPAAGNRAGDELRAAKEELRETAERWRATFSQAAIGIAVLSLERRFLEVNRKFCEIVGYPAADLLGQTVETITHPADLERLENNVQRLLTREIDEYSYEKRYLRKDGATVWTVTHATLLKDANGDPRYFIGAIEDITERKRAEAALAEERHGLETLNQVGRKLASNLDSRQIVQAVTDAATELSGAKFGAFFYNVSGERGEAYQLFTLCGAPREAFERFGMPRNTPVFAATFRGEGIVRSDDITTDPRYGTMAPHHGMPKGHLPVRSYLAVPVVSRSGEVHGGLFFGHPEPGMFTARAEQLVAGIAAQAAMAIDNARLYEREREARANAERMSELKDEFLALLSHELRTPLSAILGWAQVIASRRMEPEDLRNAIQVIERNARAQTRLIDDLLDMSRIEAGQVRLDVQEVDPAAVVQAALETVRPAAEAKAIRIQQVLDPKAGPISGDPGRLQQVFWNLLSNAIKFTSKGGRVQVILERVDSHIELSVADTGIGIPPEFLPYVFERFRQADASTTRRHGGLGLGLAIARHLVELHGGSLGAASEGANEGATFTVKLPVAIVQRTDGRAERAHPTVERKPAPATPPDLSGLCVLVVDDEADSRDLLRRVLEDCGARVRTAASARQAMESLALASADVLVTDIGMPEADGYELLRRIRLLAADRGGEMPVIALTAFARSEDRIKVMRAGFRMHVPKPVDAIELCVAVASAAGRSR
jgi:PAS domain S-box-containing protein